VKRPVALLLLLIAGLALATATVASAASLPPGESESAFAKQLDAKEVESVVINSYLREMRVTLKDGTKVSARYPKKQSEQTAAHLRAKGVAVTVLTKKAAEREIKEAKPHHHKIRYIVGGVAIVVIVVVGGVLLFNRRRRRD
jgi:ATP-dependent Zn protease